jgi:hypothetical protein
MGLGAYFFFRECIGLKPGFEVLKLHGNPGRPTRTRIRFKSAELFFDSRRPSRIAASIHVGRLESMPIHVGRLESMRRFTSADVNRCVDSRRPTRIAVSIQAGRPDASKDSPRPPRTEGAHPAFGTRPAFATLLDYGTRVPDLFPGVGLR